MNTILISGTTKQIKDEQGIKVKYSVIIWASLENEPLTFITELTKEFNSYSELWSFAKKRAKGYFLKENKLDDGAYTQYLEHLINID